MAFKEPHLIWRNGNAINLLEGGGQFFPALCEAFDQAKSSIHLETYIFNLDETGWRVLSHLRRACGRGVKVRVVLDGFGSYSYGAQVLQELEEAGAQCRIYRPEPRGWRRYVFSQRRLRRLHRKIAVVDGELGFVGGINIIDDFVDVPDDGLGPQPRFDMAVSVRGPLVQDLVKAQAYLWMRMAWRGREDWGEFYQRVRRWREWHVPRDVPDKSRTQDKPPGVRATLLLRDNLLHRKTIQNTYIRALDAAHHHVLIASAYYFPGHQIKQALRRAAKRGVRVRLLLQGRMEYALQYRACRSTYQRALDAGIQIYEYQPSYLHAKVAVIDDYAMVGSANMDPFSLLLAREANVFAHDADFAQLLRAALEYEIATHCRQVTREMLALRSTLERLQDALAHFLLRGGVALTGQSADY